MKRNRVMNPRANAGALEVVDERLAGVGAYHIEVVHGFRPRGLVRNDDTVNSCQQGVVVRRSFTTLLIPLRKVFEFDAQEAGLDRVQPSVVALGGVKILFCLS